MITNHEPRSMGLTSDKRGLTMSCAVVVIDAFPLVVLLPSSWVFDVSGTNERAKSIAGAKGSYAFILAVEIVPLHEGLDS
jgi:hypothetical protein